MYHPWIWVFGFTIPHHRTRRSAPEPPSSGRAEPYTLKQCFSSNTFVSFEFLRHLTQCGTRSVKAFKNFLYMSITSQRSAGRRTAWSQVCGSFHCQYSCRKKLHEAIKTCWYGCCTWERRCDCCAICRSLNNTLQHTATQYHVLQHTPQHTETLCNSLGVL